jgi:hypothetical protein
VAVLGSRLLSGPSSRVLSIAGLPAISRRNAPAVSFLERQPWRMSISPRSRSLGR